MHLGFCPPILEYSSAVWCSAADTHLKLQDRAVSGARFLTVTLLIIDLLQFCVCCIRSSVTRCTLLMTHYLDHMCQCGLQAVPWSHIGVLMCCLAAEPHNTAGLLFASSCPSLRSCWPCIRWCGTGAFQEKSQCFIIGLSCSIPPIVFYYFSLSLLSVYRLVLWGWGLQTDRVYITLSQPCTELF